MLAWRRNKSLLSNASSLIGTTGVASASGFAYWAVAARMFSQQAVGYGSAAVAAITLLGTIGMFGLGTVLIGELPKLRQKSGLTSAALIFSAVGSLVLGVAFSIAAPFAFSRFHYIAGNPLQFFIFSVGVAVTGMSLVFDQATVGLLRGGLQLSRNMVFAVAKLVLLPGTAFLAHDGFGTGIALSWVLGTALSLLMIAIRIRMSGISVMPRPDWHALRRLRRVAIAHNWLNLAITVPPPVMPVLVTVVVSPSANAAFYTDFMLSNFLYVIPASLSTVLFAVAAETGIIAEKLRFTLRLSLLIGIPAMLVMCFGSHLILSMFGPAYVRDGTFALWLLALGYLPLVPVSHYIAVCRANNNVNRAAIVLTIAAVVEIAASVAGGEADGLTGLSIALFATKCVEGLITTPEVLHAARKDSRRSNEHDALGVAVPVAELDERNQYGLDQTGPSRNLPGSVSHAYRPVLGQARQFTRETMPSDSRADSWSARQWTGLAALEAIAIAVNRNTSFAATGPIQTDYRAQYRAPSASNMRRSKAPEAHWE